MNHFEILFVKDNDNHSVDNVAAMIVSGNFNSLGALKYTETIISRYRCVNGYSDDMYNEDLKLRLVRAIFGVECPTVAKGIGLNRKFRFQNSAPVCLKIPVAPRIFVGTGESWKETYVRKSEARLFLDKYPYDSPFVKGWSVPLEDPYEYEVTSSGVILQNCYNYNNKFYDLFDITFAAFSEADIDAIDNDDEIHMYIEVNLSDETVDFSNFFVETEREEYSNTTCNFYTMKTDIYNITFSTISDTLDELCDAANKTSDVYNQPDDFVVITPDNEYVSILNLV
jgi:hypothetical protein